MGETEDNFVALKSGTGMSDEDQKRYVTDVGDTGSILQAASAELLKLLPRMWHGQLQNLDTLKILATLRSAMIEGMSNVEVLEAYLREWIRAGKKGETLSLTGARSMILKARAEDVVKAIKFDDDIKFVYTTSENFPEGDTEEEQRRWMLRAYAEFETTIQGFMKRVGVESEGGSEG